jgi:hypothetical protein
MTDTSVPSEEEEGEWVHTTNPDGTVTTTHSVTGDHFDSANQDEAEMLLANQATQQAVVDESTPSTTEEEDTPRSDA